MGKITGFLEIEQEDRHYQPVAERLKKSGEATDKAVTDIWAAPATLSYIREYVARTLSKS